MSRGGQHPKSQQGGLTRSGLLPLLKRSLGPRPELPDVVTFAEHRSFVGDGGPGLFPRQRTLLRAIYLEDEHMSAYDREVLESWRTGFYAGPDRWGVSPDIWERIRWLKEHGRRHFSHVIFVGGRRGGKGHLGAVMGAYEMYRLLLLGDPQAHYGLARGKDIRLSVAATNYFQARDNQFKDILTLVTGGACFREHIVTANQRFVSLATETDERRFNELSRRDATMKKQFASIRASAISSNAPAARGSACFMLVLDEFAHHLAGTDGLRTAEEVYRALTPSLDQMAGDGIIYIPTSPYSKIGHAYKLYEDALAVDEETGAPLSPDFLVIQLPSWGPYEDWDDLEATEGRRFVSAPQRNDEDLQRKRQRDPESTRIEYDAQWGEVEQGYLNPQLVERMFESFCPNCGLALGAQAACDRCEQGARNLEARSEGVLGWAYRGHVDPGVSQSNFAVVFGHAEPFEDGADNVLHHVIVDYVHVWRPSNFAAGTIDYNQIEDELVEALRRFPSLEVLTFDQYGSFVTVPRLRERLRGIGHRARVREENFNERSNTERAERFKSAIGMGLVHAYRDTLGPEGRSQLELELKYLQMKNGKVEKQSHGPVTTKDAADALMVVVSELLKDERERLPIRRRLSEARPAFGAQGGYLGGDPRSFRERTGNARERLAALHQSRLASSRWRGVRLR